MYYFSIKLLLLLEWHDLMHVLLFSLPLFLTHIFASPLLHLPTLFFLSPLSNFCNIIGTFTNFFFSLSSLIFNYRQGINWAAIVALGMPNSQFLSSLSFFFFFLRNSATLLPNFDSLLTQLINFDQCIYRQ